MKNKKQAKEILDNIQTHHLRDYLKSISIKRPSAIINAHEELKSSLYSDLDEDLIHFVRQGSKLNAVKLCREKMQINIRDAHQYVLQLIEKHNL